ncbi:MAG: DEAD/DEAH box helicase family protein [Candidatus Jordarchaeum sp.]|uniref:DEAD/DEAH box helicase family protein n=1 Tax=Candidatus Jordarchaeum sp. TaxID=2823881 RepID=UPI00404A63C5
MVKLIYDKGTILVHGVRVPNSYWDTRSNAYRALAMYYADIVDFLKCSKMEISDNVLDLIPCPVFSIKTELRDYQEDALNAWLDAGRRGVIVLPTGAGKTILALKAISLISEPTLIVVPTLDLMDQWQTQLSKEFKIKIGLYGGGVHELEPITVATYDTAYLRVEKLGNKFAFVIFDEVHHLPAPGYIHIAEMLAAPYRMGLTATYEREDGLHSELDRLVGGKIFELTVGELAGNHLANFIIEKIVVDLSPKEKEEYEKQYRIYLDYLAQSNISLKSPRDFKKLVFRSGKDPRARKALLARHRARVIALNASSKLKTLREILEKHAGDRMLIFTEYNDLVYMISKNFLIPSITHKTPKNERVENLEKFRKGKYKILVTSKVLDEGIDVPEASVGVILSGTGSRREFIQRLGRILRRKENKSAILYEIITKATSEVATSRRRRSAIED